MTLRHISEPLGEIVSELKKGRGGLGVEKPEMLEVGDGLFYPALRGGCYLEAHASREVMMFDAPDARRLRDWLDQKAIPWLEAGEE